jgi:hypothetical protein
MREAQNQGMSKKVRIKKRGRMMRANVLFQADILF